MRSVAESIEKEGHGQQVGAAARRSPPRHEVGMQPIQVLPSGTLPCPARAEYGPGACFCRFERGSTATMEQAGVVEAGHDRHEGVESGAVFRSPPGARRAEHR